MIKKAIFILLMMFLYSTSVFAGDYSSERYYLPGLLIGELPIETGSNDFMPQRATDNTSTLSATIRVNSYLLYDLGTTYNLKQFYFSGQNTRAEIIFYNNNMNEVETITSEKIPYNEYVDINLNARYVKLRNSNGTFGLSVSGFDVYTEKRNLVDINYLSYQEGTNNINLSWENPFDNGTVNIYVDGELKGITSDDHYNIIGLENGRRYSVIITTVIDGKESLGVFNGINTLEAVPLPDVENIRGQPFYNRIYLEWDNPEHEDFRNVMVYEGDQLIKEVKTYQDNTMIRDLEPEKQYYFLLTVAYDPNGEESDGVAFDMSTIAMPEVEIKEHDILNYHTLLIEFERPVMNGYDQALLYLNGQEVAKTNNNYFFLEGIKSGETHDFTIKVKSEDGFISNGSSINVTMPEAPKNEEVGNVKSETNYNRVNLSWNNPEHNPNFNFVRIYRKKLSEEQTAINAFLFGKIVSANTDYDPLFETNGDYFNDLSVEPDSDYEYLLTTENQEEEESDGVYVLASTLEEPQPAMGGVSDTTDENGNSVFSWSSPTTGDVKIFVGGDEYTTVPASDGQVVIPEGDMKYTFLGNSDIELQAISEYGKEGAKTKPGILGAATNLFTATDLLTTSMSITWLFGPFILLALAVRFFPKLVALLKKSASTKQQDRKTRS